MASKVFLMDLRATPKLNLFDKIEKLVLSAGLEDVIKARDLVAIKLHFGELGNAAYIRPVFLRKVVDLVKSRKADPFLTDANTLYAGTRSDAVSHLNTAVINGFSYSVVGAPLIIADGLRGKTETRVVINKKRFSEVYIGREIASADALISVAHFKGHELSGFGGALKNVGMGCASRKGKLLQHSTLSPKVVKKKCIGCEECVEHCSQRAIAVSEKKAGIDPEKCIGCGECILICPNGAIQIQWNQSIPVFLENMVEYTFGVLKEKEKKSFFINFLTDVSPACDCYGYNDAAIVKDIGVLASKDPVAIDQASVDLVNMQDVLPGTCLSDKKPGTDKFRALYPKVDWEIQLEYAQCLGMGSRSYELVKI